ncbi:MAG: response regulator [Anaerolineae bacterium]|nr:response regulator [Anaerolineae bacterium]
MYKKRILIVDDEETILTILKNSLMKVSPHYDVVTVSDGFSALDQLLNDEFDLVITDYNMGPMDGLELLEAVRYAQPDAELILMTAYGTHALEAEVSRIPVYGYLAKPLEVNTFRQIVKEALGEVALEQAKIVILSGEKHQEISHLLEKLSRDIGARCIFLSDAGGQLIVQTGDMGNLPVENIASLLGGGIATLVETGRALDGDTDAINLAYHEGKNEYLYGINIGYQFLLTLIINRGPYSSRLGSVWYHAQQAAVILRHQLAEAEHVSPRDVFEQSLGQAFDTELDKLFFEPDL